MASIKKEKNGTYTVQVSLGKNPKTGSYSTAKRRSIKTKKEANLIAAEIERRVAAGEYWKDEKKANLTYKDAYELWMEKFEQNHEPATSKKAKGMFDNHFLPRFGHMLLTDISPLMINDYSVELSKQFVCCDLVYSRFVAPILFAYKLELLERNPSKYVDTPRPRSDAKQSKADDFYEEEELYLFLSMSERLSEKNYKQYAFFRLLSMTGMRNQEIRALQEKDINYEAKTLYIHRAVTVSKEGEYIAERTKNKSSTRQISIDDETLKVLKKWREKQQSKYPKWNDNWLVFTNNRDSDGTKFLSTTGIRKWKINVQDLMDEESDVILKRIDIHGFRHTHISLLVQNGVSLKAIADRVGHIDTTMIGKTYAHVTKRSEDQLRDALTTLLPSSRKE